MGWKNWGYVKRGLILAIILGIAGIICQAILGFLSLNNFVNFENSPIVIFIMLPFGILSLILTVIFCGIHPSNICGYSMMILGYIFTLIVFILIGALIGWLVGKIKSRK